MIKRTLALILVLSLGILASAFALNEVTRVNTQREHVRLMELLLPNGSDFKKLAYTGDDSGIKSVHQADEGFVIETVTQGYVDKVTVLVGVTNDGTVTGLVAHRANETIGLGSRILTDHKFLSQFLNKSGSFAISVPNGDDFPDGYNEEKSQIYVDGISGATVSSKAVARCVTSAVAYVTGADAESSATSWGG